MNLNFLRQTDVPLFPKALYNRPLTRLTAGRLLVIGGQIHEFSQPTAIHQLALAAGLGECRVIMPDALASVLGGANGVYFGASTTSGSLARAALGRILELSEETDATAIGASLTNNSDTTMLIERLLAELKTPLVVFADGLASIGSQLDILSSRPYTLFILTMAEVFKLAGQRGLAIHIRPDGGLVNKVEIINQVAATLTGDLVVFGSEIIIACGDHISVTPTNYKLSLQPALYYGVLSSFWVQNRTNRAAGLAAGAFIIRSVGQHFEATANPTVSQLASTITSTLKATESW
jgi:NAD(P)H-hydrate repair Nnr-like enzyme with NAD(P)H-hydrate dehydratase domain